MYRRWRYAVVAVGIIAPVLDAPARPTHGPAAVQLAARAFAADDVAPPQPDPLRLPDSALEPIDWSALGGWQADDHASAFVTFLASCRPLLHANPAENEKRRMSVALTHVCQQALAAGRLPEDEARLFFERNFRPLRITRLGDSAGLLTGYYEPIVDGSRFPTGVFKVPIYRRPPDLVSPRNGAGPGFPNKGQALRRTGNGDMVPYYDRGQILDGALDGRHLEICWIKDQMDALLIQIQGSARVRLEDGTMLRITYDAHNGYPNVPITRILAERNIIPRADMSLDRIREWMRANPQSADEALRLNRSFMFFRITGLSDDREAIGAEGIPLTPGRSIAVDNGLHVYGTPFFIQADRPLTGERRTASFDRLMIAQDTGSAIVGPARADIYFGAGDQAGQLAGRVHHPGSFAMLVPRELDPVATGALMPLPQQRPASTAPVNAKAPAAKSRTSCPAGRPCAIAARAEATAPDLRLKPPEHRVQTRSLLSVAFRRRVSRPYRSFWSGLLAR